MGQGGLGRVISAEVWPSCFWMWRSSTSAEEASPARREQPATVAEARDQTPSPHLPMHLYAKLSVPRSEELAGNCL